MQRPTRIPLFPLDVVLLPATQLPLHIFEPRYKAMIARCLSEKIEFGMVLAEGKAVAAVGCTAAITRKIRDYSDGRMDILVEGGAPFRLTKRLDDREYYEGTVEYLSDPAESLDREKGMQLLTEFERCHLLLHGRRWINAAPADGCSLAYRMAGAVPMELNKRQKLLEMRIESHRRDFVLRWIEEFWPVLAERQRNHPRASGNGHALN